MEVSPISISNEIFTFDADNLQSNLTKINRSLNSISSSLNILNRNASNAARQLQSFSSAQKDLQQSETSTGKMADLFSAISDGAKSSVDGVKSFSEVVLNAVDSTSLLGEIMTAMTNPIGLVLTATIGATAAITAYQLETSEAAQRARELEESQQRVSEAIDNAKQASENALTSYFQTNKANEKTLAGYQNLYDELMTLVDANGKVKSGYEDRVKFITGELSQAFGVELQLIDGSVEGIDKLTGSWDNLMQKQRASMKLESMAEVYQTELQNQANLKADMDAQFQQIQEAKQALNKIYQDNGGEDLSTAINRHGVWEEVQAQKDVIAELEAGYDQMAAQYSVSKSKTDLYEQAELQQMSGDSEGAINSLNQINSILSYTKEGGATYEEIKTQAEEAYNTLASTKEMLISTGEENWRQNEEYLNALEKTNNATEEYLGSIIDNLSESGIQVSEGMTQSILDSTPEIQQAATAILNAFSVATEEEKPFLLAQLYDLGIEVDSNLATGLDSGLVAITDSTTGMVTAIRDSTGKQITEITPEFAKYLVDMGVISIDQMKAVIQNSQIAPPNVNSIDAATWATNNVGALQEEVNKHTLVVNGTISWGPGYENTTEAWEYNAKTGGGRLYSIPYATGGLITQPHLGLVGEDGPEAIIPLSPSRRGRGLQLWQQAGKWLGVQLHAAGAIVSRMQPVSYPPILRNAEVQAQRMLLQSQLNTDAIRQACKEGCESAVLAVAVENRVQAVFNPKTAAKEMADYTDRELGRKVDLLKRYAK